MLIPLYDRGPEMRGFLGAQMKSTQPEGTRTEYEFISREVIEATVTFHKDKFHTANFRVLFMGVLLADAPTREQALGRNTKHSRNLIRYLRRI